MPLEGDDHRRRLAVEIAGDLDAIAIESEHRLQRLDGIARVAFLQKLPAAYWVGCHPMAKPLLMEPLPIEFLARIALAARRHVGMGEHVLGSNGMARRDIAAK